MERAINSWKILAMKTGDGIYEKHKHIKSVQ